MRSLVRLFVLFVCISSPAISSPGWAWEHWGGDPGGMRFSPLDADHAANVGNLVRAWEFRTGDLDGRAPEVMKRTKFQATPLLVEDSLIFCSPFNEVIALDPGSGAKNGATIPRSAPASVRPTATIAAASPIGSIDQAAEGTACRARIFMGTNDVRVIALDAQYRHSLRRFRQQGRDQARDRQPLEWPGEFQITSAPVVSRGVVIVGSSIADNAASRRRSARCAPSMRGRDVRAGSFDPLIHDGMIAGHANVWAPMSADEDRGLVFLPTSSPSPDFWGGKRPGNNEHANSVVALRTETGELVWSFQTVHHDVWDYDLPAQPTLARIDTGDGHARRRDPADQAGLCVRARPRHRQAGMAGRGAQRAARWRRRRAAVADPAVSDPCAAADAATNSRRTMCSICSCRCSAARPARRLLAGARNEGLYTPPSTQGTLVFPMTGGGVNWGGAAFDPVNQILYANTSHAVHIVKLIPRARPRVSIRRPAMISGRSGARRLR